MPTDRVKGGSRRLDEDGRRGIGSRGAVWRRLVHRGGARQAGREEVATACGFARRARTLAYWSEEEGDRAAHDGLGRNSSRPTLPGKAQVRFLF